MEKVEEVRKGPWTEQEDVQLVFYVNMFGDRRWDFIAKVSGLKRSGKSCRLRWVNYLHPGLKRGKLTPNEERLVLELHSKWGNRWSRISRKLPGRTDNEIKNYWRTYMRKKAHDEKKNSKATTSPSSPSSSSLSYSNSSLSSISNSPNAAYTPATDNHSPSFYDTGGLDSLVAPGKSKTSLELEKSNYQVMYTIDDIWKDFEFSEESCNLRYQATDSPLWDYCCPTTDHSLWSMDEREQTKMLVQPMGDDDDDHHFHPFPFSNHI